MKIDPYRFMCLNTWFPSGDSIWELVELLEGRAYSEEVGHRQTALEVYSSARFFTLSQLLVCRNVSKQPHGSTAAARSPSLHRSSPTL